MDDKTLYAPSRAPGERDIMAAAMRGSYQKVIDDVVRLKGHYEGGGHYEGQSCCDASRAPSTSDCNFAHASDA